jgi:hypothetical protein
MCSPGINKGSLKLNLMGQSPFLDANLPGIKGIRPLTDVAQCGSHAGLESIMNNFPALSCLGLVTRSPVQLV